MTTLTDALRDLTDAVHQATDRPRLGHQSAPTRIHAGHLARNPHWLAQWERRVPLSHLDYDPLTDMVTVRCHEPVPLERDEVADCPGCDRTFWRLRDVPVVRGVRVARWDRSGVEDRYAGAGWTPVEEVL